jgi:guanosine-3',5'-bis(diphosphate) 3'-pyrophosphohydrolase
MPTSTEPTDLQRILDALAFAAHKHRAQRRKDVEASPYINHPIMLARVLANEAGIDEAQVLCAALLHDTIEDTETTYDEIEERFGPHIADIVAEVTDDKNLSKAERRQFQIEHAPGLSREARLVKLADKICNLRDVAASPPPEWTLARRQQYFDWAKAVVDRLRGADAMLEALFDAAFALRPLR